MEKKRRVSTDIKFKKYVLPWFLILITYLITKYSNIGHFWAKFAWFIIIAYSVLLWSLSKVEYTKDHIYLNNKKYNYEQIKRVKSFEINQNLYYIFIIHSKSIFNRYRFTQLGGLSLFSIIKSFFKTSALLNEPLVEFLDLLETNNIKVT